MERYVSEALPNTHMYIDNIFKIVFPCILFDERKLPQSSMNGDVNAVSAIPQGGMRWSGGVGKKTPRNK